MNNDKCCICEGVGVGYKIDAWYEEDPGRNGGKWVKGGTLLGFGNSYRTTAGKKEEINIAYIGHGGKIHQVRPWYIRLLEPG